MRETANIEDIERLLFLTGVEYTKREKESCINAGINMSGNMSINIMDKLFAGKTDSDFEEYARESDETAIMQKICRVVKEDGDYSALDDYIKREIDFSIKQHVIWRINDCSEPVITGALKIITFLALADDNIKETGFLNFLIPEILFSGGIPGQRASLFKAIRHFLKKPGGYPDIVETIINIVLKLREGIKYFPRIDIKTATGSKAAQTWPVLLFEIEDFHNYFLSIYQMNAEQNLYRFKVSSNTPLGRTQFILKTREYGEIKTFQAEHPDDKEAFLTFAQPLPKGFLFFQAINYPEKPE